MAYKNITISEETIVKIKKWAEGNNEKRTFSNAVEILCLFALEKKNKEREDVIIEPKNTS